MQPLNKIQPQNKRGLRKRWLLRVPGRRSSEHRAGAAGMPLSAPCACREGPLGSCFRAVAAWHQDKSFPLQVHRV